MTCNARRIATLATGLVVTTAMLVAASGASAVTTIPLPGWAVYGSLTPKKLNEPVILPKGSRFNGEAIFTVFSETEYQGILKGKLTVPPFKASLKLGGAVPTTVNVRLEEIGESEGTVHTVPFEECASTRFGFNCVEINVNSQAELYLSSPNLAGVEAPANCKTVTPILLPLKITETIAEMETESHFTGTVTIPSIECEGLQGIVEGVLLTGLMSGPENPYKIGLAPDEPTPPLVTTYPASAVSQISARFHGKAVPHGEPLTDCHFEWGTSTSYGTNVPCVGGPRVAFLPDGKSAFVTGLSEHTTYHYRIVATNSLGTSDGEDRTFTTPGAPTAAEYGRCVAKKGGEYRDSGCNGKSKKAKKGKFEWMPGLAPACSAQEKGEYTDAGCTVKSKKPHKGRFEKNRGPKFTSTSGSVTLDTGAGKLVCAAGTGAGEITGVYTGVERITLTGCEMAGKKCTSEGTNSTPSGTPGTVVSNLLATRLLGPVEGQVWTELASGEHQPYVAEFGCEGQLFRITGHASGVQAGNVGAPSATSTTSFASGQGEQVLSSELSGNGGSSWGIPTASTLAMVLSNASELSTEEIKP